MDWKEKYNLYMEYKWKELHLVSCKHESVFIICDWLDKFKNYMKEIQDKEIQDVEEKDILMFFEYYIQNNLSDYESYELKGFLFENYLKDKLIEIDLNELKQDIYLYSIFN